MRKKISFFALCAVCALTVVPANANWQYSGAYLGDGVFNDDGSRFTLSVRGGASYSFAKMENKVGALDVNYYYYGDDIIPEFLCGSTGCSGFEYAGNVKISDLPVKNKYTDFSFAAGASLGWVLPDTPQWRLEASWDHVAETEYNEAPLFEGTVTLDDGYTVSIPSSALQSTISTDVIGVMAFYDFFEGVRKPVRMTIPYIGFGIGYASTKTTMNLSDTYGDLSWDNDLQNFGEPDDTAGALQFYKSETETSNIAGLVALGFSYGLSEMMFFDFGARVMYLPEVKWKLTNADDTRHRDWISGKNFVYANIMLGLRFEF